MEEEMMSYWDTLVNDIPYGFCVMALIFFLVSLFLFVRYKGLGKGLRYSLSILLVEYVALLYCSTVFFRPTGKTATYDYMPFWSYQAYLDGREPYALIENFANVLVFIPVGLLIGTQIKNVTRKPQKWRWLISILSGAGISIGIEVLQLVFKRGFSELDDVMHNTLGCAIGYGIYCWIGKLFGNYDNKVSI